MALYRCNRCGHLSEQADELIGSSLPCPSCRTDNAVYPTVRFVQSMLTRYFAARRDLTAALLVAQKAGRASASALGENDARIASAGEQLELLVEKGEPSLARITVAAGLLGDLAKLHAA